MIPALLALFPLAAAGLALRLTRPLARAERAAIGGAALLFAIGAAISPVAPVNDQWTHFVHLREALADPVRLLDPWDRPGFTLLYAGPAALGLTAARLTSAVVAALAIAATMRAARALGLAHPWAAGLLLVAQYDFFGQASSTMTELPFAAALAIAAWGWAERRPWLVAAGLGWCGITRPEGVLLVLAGAAALLVRHRRAGPAALALAPLALWGVAGALAFRDPLWWLRSNPYDGLVGPRLDPRQLVDSFFYVALWRGQPPPLLLLEAAGAALAISGRARRLRFLLAPLALSFLVLTFVRIGLTDDWRESRYLVAVAPALALLAAAGLDALLAAFPRAAPALLLALAAAAAARELVWHWRGALAGAGWAKPLAYALALAAAGLLWRARERLPLRPALAALLLLPLACTPPGTYAKHRPPPPGGPRGELEAAPAGQVVPAPGRPCLARPGAAGPRTASVRYPWVGMAKDARTSSSLAGQRVVTTFVRV